MINVSRFNDVQQSVYGLVYSYLDTIKNSIIINAGRGASAFSDSHIRALDDTFASEYDGLEYRFIARHLKGELNRNDMFQKLNSAIHDFAKRQETWFRRMERNGILINWVEGKGSPLEEALTVLK